jgi:hypothetical protein
MTSAANLPQVSMMPWQIATDISVTGGKFASAVNDTGDKQLGPIIRLLKT